MIKIEGYINHQVYSKFLKDYIPLKDNDVIDIELTSDGGDYFYVLLIADLLSSVINRKINVYVPKYVFFESSYLLLICNNIYIQNITRISSFELNEPTQDEVFNLKICSYASDILKRVYNNDELLINELIDVFKNNNIIVKKFPDFMNVQTHVFPFENNTFENNIFENNTFENKLTMSTDDYLFTNNYDQYEYINNIPNETQKKEKIIISKTGQRLMKKR